jgi:hypothetical protein
VKTILWTNFHKYGPCCEMFDKRYPIDIHSSIEQTKHTCQVIGGEKMIILFLKLQPSRLKRLPVI